MDINFMALAAPFFLLSIIIEFVFCAFKKLDRYQLNDSVNNICSGILEEIGALPLRGLIIFSYYYLFENHAFFQFSPKSFLSWIILWLGVDFTYYWFHRVSHRNTLFWIGHSVHHQSDRYNLSVALRQGFFQTVLSWIFYLPLALLGFPTWMFVTVYSLNTIYQFWLHTQEVNKMGFLERFLNTPSHHRVHHGTNPQYIDKNYAGSLIIWDKLFGTFEPEKEPVIYGVTEPLDAWNPFYANIKVIKDMLYYGQGLKKLTLLRAFFMPPEWIIQRLEKEKITITKRVVNKKNSKSPSLYMLMNTAFAIVSYAYLSFTFDTNTPVSWLITVVLLQTLYLLGAVADNNKIYFVELMRAVFVATSLALLYGHMLIAFGGGGLFFVLNYTVFNYGSLKISTEMAPFNNLM